MLPVLNIGPFAIQTPGLIILICFGVGMAQCEKYSHLSDVNPKLLSNMLFTALLLGLVGARLGFALRYPAAFQSNLISIISLNPAMLDVASGVLIALFGAFIYGYRKGMDFWNTLDAFSPLISLAAIGFSLANLASGRAYGTPTRLPWGVRLWGEVRHPTQIYDTILVMIIAFLLWPNRNLARYIRNRINISGVISLSLFASLAFARIITESFRGDSQFLPGQFRLGQVVAWLILALSLWMMKKRFMAPG